ncbi:GNAT family N-acetyltransferase [Aureimonas leprariae]|uniref:GNAT family N-acetyltransferase n=1 Tax=Plantimonas leprariae TaxID=2615207 RepID=UPI00138729ED|nr:GNAT family N-acetyltransferase [Aureimonas leprariae]
MTRLIEATVSQLELRKHPERVSPPAIPERLHLHRLPNIPLDDYRKLYLAVGKPHHWTSRLVPDAALASEIHSSDITVFVLEADGSAAGWFELETGRRHGRTRIVHFGIMPRFRGRHLARYLLSEAIVAAFDTGASIVTLETNTLDHPAALPLYLGAGFVCVEKRLVVTPAIDG